MFRQNEVARMRRVYETLDASSFEIKSGIPLPTEDEAAGRPRIVQDILYKLYEEGNEGDSVVIPRTAASVRKTRDSLRSKVSSYMDEKGNPVAPFNILIYKVRGASAGTRDMCRAFKVSSEVFSAKHKSA